MSWKFFHNGYTWWLRIDNPEDLARYCELTDDERYGGAMMQVAYHRMNGCKSHLDSFPSVIDAFNRFNGEDLLTTTGKLLSEAHYTYFKNLAQFGFVNINRLGGCNSSNWPSYATITKEELISQITGLLGGRAAEKLALDDISTGASNDIEVATKVSAQVN